MKKVKIVRKKDYSAIVIKCKAGQELNEREARMINVDQVEGFLRFALVPKGSSFELEYHLNGLVALPDFLRMTVLSRRMFASILQSIVATIKSMEKNHFSKQLVQFKVDQVMIDPTTWSLYFLYVPVQPFTGEGSLKEVLLDIVRIAQFDHSEDVSYVQEYIKIINTGVVFSIFVLEEYINYLNVNFGRDENGTTVKCSVCGGILSAEERYCPICGSKQSAAATNAGDENSAKLQNMYDPSNDRRRQAMASEDSNQTAQTSAFAVNEDDSGVVTVFRAAQNTASRAWLERRSDMHKIIIKKTPFRIGKMIEGNDFCIRNNTVSRRHAEIIKEQGKYYIFDLNSTNGTFLNGRQIHCGVKEELSNGMFIRMANEDFIFWME